MLNWRKKNSGKIGGWVATGQHGYEYEIEARSGRYHLGVDGSFKDSGRGYETLEGAKYEALLLEIGHPDRTGIHLRAEEVRLVLSDIIDYVQFDWRFTLSNGLGIALLKTLVEQFSIHWSSQILDVTDALEEYLEPLKDGVELEE